AARDLGPLIRAARDEIEANRHLPDSLVDAMANAGLFRMYVPRALGGFEVDPVTFSAVVEEVSRFDGAAGWNLTVGAVYGVLAGFLREDVAREIYCGPTPTVVAGSINPTGRATAVDGGFRVSGRWSLGSGINQANWVTANCVVYDGDQKRVGPDGAPDLRVMFFPAQQCEIRDTWRVSGLRGTGSHDYVVDDVFVPEERSLVAFIARPVHPGVL